MGWMYQAGVRRYRGGSRSWLLRLQGSGSRGAQKTPWTLRICDYTVHG